MVYINSQVYSLTHIKNYLNSPSSRRPGGNWGRTKRRHRLENENGDGRAGLSGTRHGCALSELLCTYGAVLRSAAVWLGVNSGDCALLSWVGRRVCLGLRKLSGDGLPCVLSQLASPAALLFI